MSDGWVPLVRDLERRQVASRAMGGEHRLDRQHANGRLDARQRVDRLLDSGSFTEIGTLVGAGNREGATPADGLVAGHGLVDGRPVLVGAEDFTVLGGSIGPGNHAKRHRLCQLALQERVPLVLLLDGAGERASSALDRRQRAPTDLQGLVALSGLVPTVAVVMGPSAGHGALAAPLMDHVIMVEGSALFSAGPPLVAQATGEQVEKEPLGGATVHTSVSGVAHDVAADDESALEMVRRRLSYFPSNAWTRAPQAATEDAPRLVGRLTALIPTDLRQPYDIRPVVTEIADAGSVLEVQARFGTGIVTALARLGGRPIAIVANQPAVRAGAIDVEGATKAARFLEIAGSFHLPAVFVADNPGVLAGTVSERAGILRASARLYAAQARLAGPKLHVTLRKAYGFGSSLMAMNPFDAQTVALALPGARLGAMPATGAAAASGADAVTGDRLADAELTGAYRAADTLGYDELIAPAELRNALLRGLRLAAARLDTGPVAPVASPGVLP